MIKTPDFRGWVAIVTALAVIIQQALPGTRWAVIATVVIGALTVHAVGSSSTSTAAPTSTSTAAPTSTSTAAPTSTSTSTRSSSSTSTRAPSSTSTAGTAVTAAQPALGRPYVEIPPSRTIRQGP